MPENNHYSELISIADTIERNGGWRIAAIKVRAAALHLVKLAGDLIEAQALLARVKPSAWIECRDQLPTVPGTYIAYVQEQGQLPTVEAIWFGINSLVSPTPVWHVADMWRRAVTHWQPMPEGPTA